MSQLPQVILEGMFTGSIIGLVALGLSLIWGVMSFINFAQSELLMMGMYLSYWFTIYSGVDPIIGLPFIMIFMYFFGVGIYRLFIKRVLAAPLLTQILVTFSLSTVLVNLSLMLFTGEYRTIKTQFVKGSVEFLGMTVALTKLVPLALCLITTAAIYYVFNKTDLGRAIKATAMNPTSAALVGIDPNLAYERCFGLAAATSGCAGVALSYYFYVFPLVGSTFSNLGFVAVCIGGMGSIPGALIGGIIMGIIDSTFGVYFSVSLKYFAVFVAYLIIVTKRPKGLFGW